jgi:hypothetical protein
MSKPMLVTLPFVMLLLDYWPLQRLSTLNPQLLPAARVGKMAVLFAHDHFVRRHFSGATPRRRGHDLPTISAAFAVLQRLDCLRAVSRKNILAGRAWPSSTRCPIICPGFRAMTATAIGLLGGISWLVWRMHRRMPVFAGRLALVFGNARARHRAGAGGQRGDGGSLHLFSSRRRVHRRGVRRPRSGEPVSIPESRGCRRRRFDARAVPDSHRKPIALLARQRIAFCPCARGDQKQSHARNQPTAWRSNKRPNWPKRSPSIGNNWRAEPDTSSAHNNRQPARQNGPAGGSAAGTIAKPSNSIRPALLARRPRAVLVELGRFDEALSQFTEAARLDPAYPAAHFRNGQAAAQTRPRCRGD